MAELPARKRASRPASRVRKAWAPSAARLGSVIRRFASVRVLVVGDLMLDEFIWGHVERISPEAPVPVVRVTQESLVLGGAANVVHNIRALNGRVTACGVVGADRAGHHVIRELKRIGAGTAGVVTSRHTVTVRKTRIIAQHHHVVRFDREQPERLRHASTRLMRYLESHAGSFDVVLLSDYGKGVIVPAMLATIQDLCRRRAVRLVIDPKMPNFAHYRGVALATPNLLEAAIATGIEIHDDVGLQAAGRRLIERWEAEAILITRGEHGMSLFKRDGSWRHFPTAAREVFDVTGAGDTVVAVCALALGAGASFEEAALLANHAASVVVGKVGTATLSPSELGQALKRES